MSKGGAGYGTSYVRQRVGKGKHSHQETNNTNVTIFIGEYSVFQVDTPSGVLNFSDPPDTHIFYPRLLSAIAESVYLLGAERNPNVVKLSSYAPSLQNWNWYNWTPNLIAFDADPNHTLKVTLARCTGPQVWMVMSPCF
jgi:hypothetical protein